MPPNEAELIRLHAAHAERVFRYAWSITKQEPMAEDVVQELFLKLARDVSSITGARSEAAMLLTMTRNLAVDALRRAKSRDTTQKRWAAELPEWFEIAEDQDLAHQQARLTAALASLPEEQRSAVHLHVWEGLTFREIGEIAGLPTQTIVSRYRYGLTKLRAALETSPTP